MTAQPRFPACFVEMPSLVGRRRAAFYLAAEEYLATAFPVDNYLFSWVLAPTVVMGRNQLAAREVDLDFCRIEGIDVIRRKSGGGCIFANEGNVMFSLVTGEGAVEPIFAEYAAAVAQSLVAIGVPAMVSGRNDILLTNGTKVCGNAFYRLAHRNIVHGTMLYDTNYRLMLGALNPDVSKLKAAGVESVRSRTGLIKDVLPIGVEALRDRLHSLLCNRRLTLTAADVAEIEKIEQTYYLPDFLYGNTGTRGDAKCAARIEGCGSVEIAFTVTGGTVTGVTVSGDFFSLETMTTDFEHTFVGLPFALQSLQAAAEQRHPEKSIRGLTVEALNALLATLPYSL